MDSAALATLGVKVEAQTSEGTAQVNRDLQSMASTAESTTNRVKSTYSQVGTSMGQMHGVVGQGVAVFNNHSDAITRNAGSMAYLLRSIGQLTGGNVMMAAQMERVALLTERMVGLSDQHITKQQVLSNAMSTGAISTATMAAAQEKLALSLAKSAAAQGALSTAQAAAQKVVSLQQELAIAQSNFVSSGGGPGQMVLWQQMQATETELNRAKLASAGLTEAQAGLTAANKEVASSQKLINDAMTASTFSIGGTVAVIAGVVAGLVVLAAAAYAMKKAWDILWSSIAAAGAQQSESFSFKFLIGNIDLAEQKMQELKSFWQEAGVFKFGDLSDAARQLMLIGTGSDNVIERLKEMSSVAAATGESVGGIVSAYERVRIAIEKGTDVQTRGLGASSGGTIAIIRALKVEMGLTETQIHDAFLHGKIDIDTVNKALYDSTNGVGQFAGAIDAKRHTWDGALAALDTQWMVIKEHIGTPIIDTLTVILERWTDRLSQMGSTGDTVGAAISKWITDWDAAIENGKFGDKLAKSIVTGLLTFDWSLMKTEWTILFYDLPVAAWTKFTDWYTKWNSQITWSSLIASSMPGAHTAQSAAPPPNLPSEMNPAAPINHITLPGTQDEATLQKTLKDFDTYKTDLKIINDYWEQYTQIQMYVADATERERRVFELTAATAKELYNPEQFNPYMGKLGELMKAEAERGRKEQEIDIAIRVGSASTMDSITRGIEKAKQAFGNMDQMIEKMSTSVVNALDNDIANGLVSIMDGTKSVAQGFRDMALSIIADIEKIIIKMMVEYALQQAIGAMGVGGSVGSIVSSSGQGAHGATGGTVFGGSGTRDDVPAMLTGGEYVFSKDAVSNAGGASAMDRWHEAAKAGQVGGFAAGGEVVPGRTFYGTNFGGSTVSIGGDPNPRYTPTNMPGIYSTRTTTFGGSNDPNSTANAPFSHGTYPGESALTEEGTYYAAFPSALYKNGTVTGGQWYQVLNPENGMTTWVQALDAGPGSAGGEQRNGMDISPAAMFGGLGITHGHSTPHFIVDLSNPVTGPGNYDEPPDLTAQYDSNSGISGSANTGAEGGLLALAPDTNPFSGNTPFDISNYNYQNQDWSSTIGSGPAPGDVSIDPSYGSYYSPPVSTDTSNTPAFADLSNTTPGGDLTVSQNTGGMDIHDFGADTSLGTNLTDSQYLALQTPVNTTTPSDFNQAQWDSGMWGYNAAGNWTNWTSPDLQNAASSQPWQQNAGQTWQQNATSNTGGDPFAGLPAGAFETPSDPYANLSSLGYSPGPLVSLSPDFGGNSENWGGGGNPYDPRQHAQMHGGGLVIPSFATGGIMPNTGLAHLHAGEGIIPANQMASMSPTSAAAPNMTSHVQVTVHFHEDGSSANMRTERSSAADKQARDLARTVEAFTIASMRKQQRIGGATYRSRN